MSGHKIYGPKGSGFLYVKSTTPFSPILFGGGQEFGYRAGTENVLGIVGLGYAVRLLAQKKAHHIKRISLLAEYMRSQLVQKTGACLTLSDHVAPHIIHVFFEGSDGETLLMNLDLAGIAASHGSACTSGSLTVSHVLRACGYTSEQARGGIRFSIGKHTTKRDIDYLIRVLQRILSEKS